MSAKKYACPHPDETPEQLPGLPEGWGVDVGSLTSHGEGSDSFYLSHPAVPGMKALRRTEGEPTWHLYDLDSEGNDSNHHHFDNLGDVYDHLDSLATGFEPTQHTRRMSVKKYSATSSDVHNLLSQLNQPEHNETRWGVGGDRHLRGVTADALQDNDRNQEAEWVRNPEQHVMIRDGRVVPARFTDEPANHAYNDLWNYADSHDESPPEPNFFWKDFRPEDMHDSEDFKQPPKRHEVRVVWPDESGTEPHSWADVPYHHLGKHLAWELQDFLSRGTDISPEDENYARLKSNLENAPYEEEVEPE